MRRTHSLILIAGILLALLSGCIAKSDEQMIMDRMDKFAEAYSSGDLGAALDCMDAKTRNMYKSVLNIGNALLGGIEIEDIFSLGIGVVSEGDALRFSNIEISFNSDTRATVTAIMHFETRDDSDSEKVSFNMVKENGDWYLSE